MNKIFGLANPDSKSFLSLIGAAEGRRAEGRTKDPICGGEGGTEPPARARCPTVREARRRIAASPDCGFWKTVRSEFANLR